MACFAIGSFGIDKLDANGYTRTQQTCTVYGYG